MIFSKNEAVEKTYNKDNILCDVFNINGTLVESNHYAEYNINKDLYFFHGAPVKKGKYIIGDDGNQIEFRGIGTHALLQYGNLHTLEALSSLRDLGVNLIRITVYIENYTFLHSDGQQAKGYIAAPTETKAEIEKIVNYCEQLGLYVLLDWHVYSWGAGSGTGIFHEEEATEFFTYFCTLYKDKPFVMYEIANEPHHQTINEYVPFVTAMHTLIHSIVENPIIVTGTCKDNTTDLWSAFKSNGLDDIFISSHAYGNSINVDKYKAMWDVNMPIFNTEWGNAQASGDGNREDERTIALIKYYHEQKIPHSVWKLTDQAMTCAVLKNTGNINSEKYATGFTEEDLSAEGTLYFIWFKYFATIGHNR